MKMNKMQTMNFDRSVKELRSTQLALTTLPSSFHYAETCNLRLTLQDIFLRWVGLSAL